MKTKYRFIKKLICTLLIGTMLLPNTFSSNAEEYVSKPLEVKFSKFKVELNEYSKDSHYVEYEKLGSKEIAHVKDKNGVEVDTFELNLATGRSHNETLPF